MGRLSRRRTEAVLVRRYRSGSMTRRPDDLVVEEPMEIHLDGVLVATTMRTPGHDFELAVGFCLTDGLLGGAAVTTARYCATGSAVETAFNVVSVDTGGLAPTPVARIGTTSSSCGLCGSPQLLGDLTERLQPLPAGAAATFPLARLLALPEEARSAQELFGRTGAVHAAAAFGPSGPPLVVREDVGRHNAVDKVVGRLLLDDALPAHHLDRPLALAVSGRASFEIVQKAWAAGFSALVAVSAPSALAVATARRAGMVLIGFARRGDGNVYAPEDPLA